MKGKQKKTWKKILTLPEMMIYQSNQNRNIYDVRLLASGNYKRRRVTATDVEHAIEQGREVFGFNHIDEVDTITIADAFEMTLKNSNRNASRDRWLKDAVRFVEWLEKNHPTCNVWKDVTRKIVRSYIENRWPDNATNTIRIGFAPVRQASIFMSREYDLKDVAVGLGIGKKSVKKTSDVLLEDVVEFLDFLLEKKPWLETGPALQGLAGLQLQEATRLTWDKVDLERGLIEISGRIKNDHRERTIPVCSRVLEALHRANERRLQVEADQNVKLLNGHVVTNVDGVDGYEQDYHSYSRRVRKHLREWNSKVTWPVKDLRNCLVTFCQDCGLQSELFDQYIGHAGRSISDLHYKPRRLETFTKAERKRQEHALHVFRRLVIEPIDAGLTGHRPQMVLQLFCNSEEKQVISDVVGER